MEYWSPSKCATISGADVIARADRFMAAKNDSHTPVEHLCRAIIAAEMAVVAGLGDRDLNVAALHVLRQRLKDRAAENVNGTPLFEDVILNG